jgi:hypothetical protein
MAGTLSAVGGTAALFCATFAGICCAGVYSHAPDDLNYGNGQAVRRSLLNSQVRSNLILAGCALYLSGLALWFGGPMLPTIAGLPLYTMATIVFVGGFAYICCSQRLPLPEMVLAPFLLMGLVYRFPDLASIGGAALGLAIILATRWIVGLIVVVILVMSNDRASPRLYGMIPDETWMFFSGASAWVGQDHILGLVICSGVLMSLGCFGWLIYEIYLSSFGGKNKNLQRLTSIWANERHFVLPWSGLITVAMLLEMVIRHECPPATLSTVFPSMISNMF